MPETSRKQAAWTPEKRKQAADNARRGWQNRDTYIAALNRRGNSRQISRKAKFKGGPSVRALRMEFGDTQQEFAKRLGYSMKSRQRVSKVEAGTMSVTSRMIGRMEKIAAKHKIDWKYEEQ